MSEGSIRERLAALSRGELIGLVALLAVTLGGAGLWYVRSLPRPVEVSTTPSGGTASAPGVGEPVPGGRSSSWTSRAGFATPACTSSPRAPG